MAWFICTMKIRPPEPGGIPFPVRYCALDDFTDQIAADGGAWSHSEVLGSFVLGKVRASAATLSVIAGTTGFHQLPAFARLDDLMSGITTTQRNNLLTRLQNMGYTTAEISGALGSNLTQWRTRTWRQLLTFAAQRRLLERWDDVQQQIVLDGPAVPCTPIAAVDAAVSD